jgi:hypothetical protein
MHIAGTRIARRRIVAGTLVSTVLAVIAAMSLSAATASAYVRGTCEAGEFCLGDLYHLTGGMYENAGDVNDLTRFKFYYYADDRYNAPVAYDNPVRGNSWSAYNHGRAVSSGRNDVMVYTAKYYGVVPGTPPGFTGAKACIALGRRLDLPASWRDKIVSFRWVTRGECNGAPRL